MEAFSLLKYWRGGGAVVGTDATAFVNSRTTATNTTILAAVAEDRDESDSDSESDGDDGPFFDLEFSVPDEDESEPRDPDPVGNSTDNSDSEAQPEDNDDEDEESDEREFNFTVSSGSPRDHTGDPNLTLSPSDDLFFKGKLVPIEPTSIEFNPSDEPNSKPQFAGALLKSATKFRVFMLGLKKPKPNSTNSNGSSEKSEKTEPPPPVVSAEPPLKPSNSPQKTQVPPPQQKQKQQGKLFTVKFKVEEVPIVSLFTRDNSSRISTTNKLPQKEAAGSAAQQKPMISTSEESASSEEKRFPKEVVQKYLKMVKPLYVRVSKRYSEKLRLSGQLRLSGPHSTPASSPVGSAEQTQTQTQTQPGTEVANAAPPSTAGGSGKSGQKQGNFPAGLRVVCKHLGKSRSASSAVAAAPAAAVVSQRRDDSLLQQQDGIQSAILHCKRSFNASRDLDSSLLPRSVKEKSAEVSSKSLDLGKGVSL